MNSSPTFRIKSFVQNGDFGNYLLWHLNHSVDSRNKSYTRPFNQETGEKLHTRFETWESTIDESAGVFFNENPLVS